MIAANTGLIVEEYQLGQLSDANGKQLSFTKQEEGDFYIGEGTNTEGYSWTYIADRLPSNQTKLSIIVKKTRLEE